MAGSAQILPQKSNVVLNQESFKFGGCMPLNLGKFLIGLRKCQIWLLDATILGKKNSSTL